MKITWVRRICQAFFLLLFFWFCAVASVGDRWWQLRGWPVNGFLYFDPLAALGTLLTTGTLYAGMAWALAAVLLTLAVGRFFCGWVCPFGTLQHLFGYLARFRAKTSWKIRQNRYRDGQTFKYLLLTFLLAAAAAEAVNRLLAFPRQMPYGFAAAAVILFVLAAAVRRRGWATAVAAAGCWFVLGRYLDTEALLTASLQTGLLDPIPLLHRAVNLVLLPLADQALLHLSVAPRLASGAGWIGGIFLAVLLLSMWQPRFYCRFICPLGALFGVFSRHALWRIGRIEGACRQCRQCETDCEGACRPAGRIMVHECVLCMNCLYTCRDGRIGFQTRPLPAGESRVPDVGRRKFAAALVSGLAAVPFLRLGGAVGADWHPGRVRPPGALDEKRFLDRCIKCGQCMRICPTNVIQPAGLSFGWEALWTPVLNFRIGSSGCQLNCIACGNVCPTAAIRPMDLDEKLGRGDFAAEGPVRIGTAFVDPGRCLPWAMDRPCIVCQENCPVSPKAIFTRTHFSPLHTAVPLAVQSDAGRRIDLTADPPAPVRFAGGDYFCRWQTEGGQRRLRITGGSGRRLTLEEPDGPPTGSRIDILIRLQRPFVDPLRCIGCGVCEHECPVQGLRAIRVTAENETREPEHRLVTG